MGGLIDGVSKVFIVRHEGGSMHFDGHDTLNEAALHLLRMDSYKPDWAQRMEEFRKAFEHVVKYHNHDCVWKPDSCGAAICECGAYAEGWYCPDSPSHLCSYEKGDFDQCDHCGQPEERK
jgi:hypothetical protein